MKEADKSSGIVVWDRENDLAEARIQIENKDIYQELKGNIGCPLEKIVKSVLRKVRNRTDIIDETLDPFWLTTQSLGDFIYFQRYKNGLVMYLGGRLYLFLDIKLKMYQLFLNIILSRSHRKLNHILRPPMIFYVN